MIQDHVGHNVSGMQEDFWLTTCCQHFTPGTHISSDGFDFDYMPTF